MKIVLVEPEIPHNTGAIGRTCVALDLELILIKPLGFAIDDTNVARSGTRYWKYVNLSQYDNWGHFISQNRPKKEEIFFFEETGQTSFYDAQYSRNAYLIFGSVKRLTPRNYPKNA